MYAYCNMYNASKLHSRELLKAPALEKGCLCHKFYYTSLCFSPTAVPCLFSFAGSLTELLVPVLWLSTIACSALSFTADPSPSTVWLPACRRASLGRRRNGSWKASCNLLTCNRRCDQEPTAAQRRVRSHSYSCNAPILQACSRG